MGAATSCGSGSSLSRPSRLVAMTGGKFFHERDSIYLGNGASHDGPRPIYHTATISATAGSCLTGLAVGLNRKPAPPIAWHATPM